MFIYNVIAYVTVELKKLFTCLLTGVEI